MSPLKDREKKRIDFRGKLYLAPLTTVGNLPFRRLCVSMGAEITCGEMVLASHLLRGDRPEWALTRRHSSEKIFGVQLAGHRPEVLMRTAEILEREFNVDFIDINSGCPIDSVFNSGAGSALMDASSRVRRMITGITQVVDCPVTIKMRMGVLDNKPMAHKFVSKLEEWGCSLMTVYCLFLKYIRQLPDRFMVDHERNGIRDLPIGITYDNAKKNPAQCRFTVTEMSCPGQIIISI